MQRWQLVVAMAAMFILGALAGGAWLGPAQAQAPAGHYQIIPLERVDKDDPVALRFETVDGTAWLIRRTGEAIRIVFP